MQSLSPTRQRGVNRPQNVSRQRPRSLDRAVSTAAALHVMTLAPAWPQALPFLAQVPAHYSHEANGELLYKLCAALTAKGLGSPDTWVKCGRNCVAFARYSIMNAIGAERGELLRLNVEWRLEVSDTFSDGYFTADGDPPVEQGKLCVTAACNGSDTSGSVLRSMHSSGKQQGWVRFLLVPRPHALPRDADLRSRRRADVRGTAADYVAKTILQTPTNTNVPR